MPVVGWLLAAFYTQSPQDLPFTFSLNPHLSRSLTADAWTVTRPLPEWKHLAVCCYGQHAIGFVNGKPSAPVPLEKLDPTLSNIVLGSPAVRDRWTFHGAIAGFRISTSPRYAGPFEPPMVLDDTDGAYVALDFSRPVPGQVRDLTGHGHHGALTGAKWVRREADGLVEIDPPPVQSPFHANLMKPLPPRLTNALSTVLLPDDALAGDWKLEGGQLTSPKDARALLLVRTPELPRRYSVNLAVELIEGKGELVVGLLAGGRAFSARLTNDHRGFDRVDGKPSSANETTTRGETFPPGTSVTLTCSTSDDAVRVFGRGGVLCSYQGSWERLSPDPEWSVGEPSLFLGTSDSVFRIKQFLVTPNEGLPRQRRPPEEELALVRKEFAEAMGAELTRPAGSEALRLTSKYRSMAFERHYSMAQRYVLLEESLRRARESKNAVSVLHAVDSLEMFEGEGIPRPASVLEELHEETPPGDGQAQLCKTALNASDNLRMRERLAEAQALLDLAVKAAERAGDDALLAKASAQRDEFRALQEYVEPGQKAERALAVSPQDSSALAARGKYYALVLLRWEGGLRHLKEGDDAALARVAELELASPKEGPALLRLADAWHQAAQSAESAARPTFQRKAMQWYRLALTKLPEGASKTRAERRYEELKEIVGEPDEGGAAQ
jgi:tetratricopeptide (TPR) repeat protein